MRSVKSEHEEPHSSVAVVQMLARTVDMKITKHEQQCFDEIMS